MSEIILNESNFKAEINSDKPVLVDFFATWCGPCKMMAPLVEELANTNSDIKVGKIDIDENEDVAIEYKVRSIPTFILFKNGEEAKRHVGAMSEADLAEFVK
ncbi:MAG: thioredoxin [Lachnospiraceae bacterium]|nr:thioredoxin [Lachnospiraceae bacterium]MBR5357084.1 thioredoxin [Lachnospiraceae bacterium]